MFTKFISGIVASMMVASVALAGPAPKGKFESYVKEVAKETGKTEKEVREKAIEALRTEGKYSEAELKRIGGEKIELDAVKQNEMVNLLRSSKSFRPSLGIAAVRNEKTSAEVKEDFGKMKNENAFDPSKAEAPKAEAKKAEAPKKAEKKSATEAAADPVLSKKMEKSEAVALKKILKFGGEPAFDAVMEVAKNYPSKYLQIRREATKLSERVAKGTISAEKAKQMIIDVANSAKVLNGELVTGEGASEACANMARDAVENFADFIRGGAIEGKDAVSYTKGMGKAAAEKFKQEFEEGLARVCALANSGCGLYSGAIQSACKSMAGARAL